MTAPDDFAATVKLTLETGAKLKARMLERGIVRSHAKCPRCGGRLDGALSGPKKHLRMACQTQGCLQMME